MKDEINTILLIGRSGRGKSTLANVVTNSNNFKESDGSTSETRKIQFEKFEFDFEQEKLKKLLDKVNRELEKESYRRENSTEGLKSSFFDRLKALFNRVKKSWPKLKEDKRKTKILDIKHLDQEQLIDKIIKEVSSGKNFFINDLTLENKQTLQKVLWKYLQNKDGDKGTEYYIIDTPGIGDTKLTQSEVLDIIAEAVYLVRGGLNQVFFVTNGRFDQSEMSTYDLLRTIIFDQNITKYTTIIRTCFKNFRTKKECEEDISRMSKEGGKLSEVIISCQRSIVHVNNPSIEITTNDENELDLNKIARNKSREKILNHLEKNYRGVSYKPPKLQELSAEIIDYMERKIKLKKDLEELKSSEFKQEEKKTKPIIRGDENKLSDLGRDNSTESTLKEEESVNLAEKKLVTNGSRSLIAESGSSIDAKRKVQSQEIVASATNSEVEKEIRKLESKREELKKEIQEKEKIIRQKVLEHIFNNYGNITNIQGGDNFINNVTEDNNNWQKGRKNSLKSRSSGGSISEHLDSDEEEKIALRELSRQFEEMLKARSKFDSESEEENSKEEQETNIQKANVQEKNWTTIHPSFTLELIQSWQDLNFTYQQTQDWISINLQPADYNFANWLQNIKKVDSEWVLNHGNQEKLKQEFQVYQEQFQSQIQQPPK